MKKLKTYEAPTTRVAKVTLKTSMLAGSIFQGSKEEDVEAKGHEIGNNYEFDVSGAGGKVNGNANKDFSVEWD